MTKSVYIHAGAHRTGTSSFQLCLHRNRQVLSGQGLDIAYPGRDGVPDGRLKLQLPRPRHGEKRIPQFADKLRGHLGRLSPDPLRGLILSEENIPGPMTHFYEGRFFPASAKRLAALAAALDGPPRHVLYVLRPYDQLYISAYRKRAEDNPVPPFPDLVPHFLAMDRGWPDLIVEMRDILRPERLSILDYAHRGTSSALLAGLVPGLAASDLAEPDQVVNLSATDAALIALQRRYHAGESLSREEWKSVLNEHAENRAPQGVAAFSDADATSLRSRYAGDLTRIAKLDGVALL